MKISDLLSDEQRVAVFVARQDAQAAQSKESEAAWEGSGGRSNRLARAASAPPSVSPSLPIGKKERTDGGDVAGVQEPRRRLSRSAILARRAANRDERGGPDGD